MKILRIFSIALMVILLSGLVLGNIFYRQVREFIEPNTKAIYLSDEEYTRLERLENPDYAVRITTDDTLYQKYQKIRISARMVRKKDHVIPENAIMEASILLQDGTRLLNLNGKEQVKMTYNPAKKAWVGYFIPLSVDASGTMTVKVTGYPDSPESPVSGSSTIQIREVPPAFTLKKGQTLVGIDMTERISKQTFLSLDFKMVDWNYIPEWLNILSGDGVMMMAGVTKTYDENTSQDNPWDNDLISDAYGLADRLKSKNKTLGVWIRALRVEGIYAKRISYQLSDVFNDGKWTEENSRLSLGDENRKKQLIRLFTSFMGNDSIAYVGFSDLFTQPNEGLELADAFLSDNQLSVPSEWNAMDTNARLEYFAGLLKDTTTMDNFRQWKKTYTADYIRDIIGKSGHTKPVFYYMDIKELQQTPDLVPVLLNSGVDFVVLNLNSDFKDIPGIIDSIQKNAKISAYFNRIIISVSLADKRFQVNAPNYDRTSIENYLEGNQQLFKSLSAYYNANGVMIDDFYKAMKGDRGIYSTEWMTGIGQMFYDIKSMNRDLALAWNTFTPSLNGNDISIPLSLANRSIQNLNNVRVEFYVMPLKSSPKSLQIGTLAGGKELVTNLSLTLNETNSQFVRNKIFIGIRVYWSEPNGTDEGGKNYSFLTYQTMALRNTTNR